MIASHRIERAFVSIDEGQVHLRQIVAADPVHVPLFLFHASPSSSCTSRPAAQLLRQRQCLLHLVCSPMTYN